MTQSPAPSTNRSLFADGRGLAMLNYALLFFMSMSVGATGIVALIVANFADSDKTPAWIKSHYQFQIRTFWIGILPTLLTFFLSQYLLKALQVEPLYMFAVVIPVLGWIAARCAMGFNHLLYGRPYPTPKSWLV
ncbi:membrane protein-like protein [Asticcacaulis biprosthecium C19]|uniref:Membrane protein-like protein n=1 Tax=Asticcacaulis biprosthecium C19 TaxID=715226 RepID=F4QPI6_9CAUL|nr:hypothetical protein [Asticcacaulis biprosthecium]EGF91244.1 membrane protein-like protein [Asticcacaulis biprosthecium C19]